MTSKKLWSERQGILEKLEYKVHSIRNVMPVPKKIINGSEYAKNRIEFELWNMHINMLLLHSSQTLYLLIILY